jgi:hypothetical protein
MHAAAPDTDLDAVRGRPTAALSSPWPAAALVAVALAASWLVSGVPVASAALFAGYELAYVLLPGCLLYVLLTRAPGGLARVIALGWPLGYALELGAYALTAALHARAWFAFLPLLAAGAMGGLASRRFGRRRLPRGAMERTSRRDRDAGRRGGTRGQAQPGELLALAAAIAAAVVLLALTFFAAYPLPGVARSVVYYVDNVWDISIAAEALHHWPLTEPYVAGHSLLHYYYGVFLHFAAVTQVTGVALSTTVLRLFPASAIVVIALQLWTLCRALSRSRWTGPLAVVLLLVAEDLNLDPTRPGAFGAELLTDVPLSPTMTFGMIFFLGLLLALQPWLSRSDVRREDAGEAPAARGSAGAGGARETAGELLLVGMLVVALSIVKASASVDFLGGLALLWLLRARARGPLRRLSLVLALSVLGAGAVYLLVLRGGLGSTLRLSVFAFVKYTNFGSILNRSLAVRVVPLSVAAFVSMAFTLAPLAGACWLFHRRSAVTPFVELCVAIFATSLGIYLLVGAPSDSQAYFMYFGYLALVPVAAYGSTLLWRDVPPRARRALASAAAAVLALGLALATSTIALSHASGAAWLAWYVLGYGLLAVAVALAALRIAPALAPVSALRRARLLACCAPLLVVLGLVKPLAMAAPNAWKAIAGTRVSSVDSRQSEGMTAALYRGLLWVRGHTRPCEVLAVNNHLTKAGAGPGYSSYYYYSAFTERRVFLESWGFTPEAAEGGQPFRARLALEDRATVDGDAAALRELRRDGVRYVLIDELHGGGAPEPASVSRRVFANGALVVYRLVGQGRAPERCDT